MDTLSKRQRSERMARVQSKDTKPEMIVRRLLHGMGYRYRLHRSDLPGRPDIVMGPRRAVIFVNGCFWHRHQDPDCKLARLPKSNTDFWVEKLSANRDRDAVNRTRLRELNWNVLDIWECEVGDRELLVAKIEEFLARCAQ